MKADLIEAEGLVHAVNIRIGGEFTLCGDAFDLASDIDGYGWVTPTTRTITCDQCVKIIRSLRGLHTK